MMAVAGGIILAALFFAALYVVVVLFSIKAVRHFIGITILVILGLAIVIPWMIYGWDFMQTFPEQDRTISPFEVILTLLPYGVLAFLTALLIFVAVAWPVMAYLRWVGIIKDDDAQSSDSD